MALFMVKTWMGNKVTPIYGAEWAGTSDPSWTRTDDAVGFSAPNPYYSGMSTTPSSPFDNILPWSGMRRVTDANAGELVEIPKFYYKWTRDGSKMKLQISMTKFDGFLTSPAHADRGDGVGERDYVYVGRYHCVSTYKSSSGSTPTRSKTRSTFRSGIHNLGTNIWQWDFAMYWTICMLYLVEFAHWNSQTKIGYGGGNGSGFVNNGQTDNISYHTGTSASGRTTYGYEEYRHIEGLWSNAFDFIDGIYFNGYTIYAIKNPADFSDSTGGTNIGTRASASGYIKGWTAPSGNDFNYALFPSSTDSSLSGSTYVCDISQFDLSATVLLHGGYFAQNQSVGLFCLFNNISGADSNVGSRLMVLPPSRLSA